MTMLLLLYLSVFRIRIIITLVESDPFYGYESETFVAHLTKLNDIATLFSNEEKIVTTISLSYFHSH